jgi:hypothetical protein
MANIFDFVGTSGGSQASYKTEYKRYYQTDIGILLHNNEGALVNSVVLKEAYPVSLSDVNLSWSENNKLYEFSVRFTFKEWYYFGYNMEEFESGAVLSPFRTSEIAPQVTDSPRPGPVEEYSSATESSTNPNAPKYPQINRDAENFRKGRGSAPGASGLTLQEDQTVIGR